uniref:Reverse transcriptase domain-containing protein n=1 Tax=Oryzias latipes TaxID=8090 RepID=A0A3B3I7Y7_ORYLA
MNSPPYQTIPLIGISLFYYHSTGIWNKDSQFQLKQEISNIWVSTFPPNYQNWCNFFDKVSLRKVDPAGRFLVIYFEWIMKRLSLINIYASNDQVERKRFFHLLRPNLSDDTILIRDFNTVLSRVDLSVNNTYKEDVGRQELVSLMLDNNIIDIWRLLNPNKRDFSRRQVVKGQLKQSRIDHVLAAQTIVTVLLPLLRGSKICGGERGAAGT